MEVASTTLRLPAGARPDRRVLIAALQRTVKRHDQRVSGYTPFQHIRCALDLALAGEEGEDAAGLASKRITNGLGHCILDLLVGIAGPIADIDGKRPAFAFQHRRIAQQRCHACAVERRRHDQKLQIRPQARLHVERQCQAEIRIETALVELVEKHGGNVFQVRIVEDHPGEDAFGDDEDARLRRDLVFEPHAIADRCATSSPSRLAMRLAAARAARRRGSSRMMVRPLHHGAPRRCSGTSVVLPAPGGATSTAALPLQRFVERGQNFGDGKGRQVYQGVVSGISMVWRFDRVPAGKSSRIVLGVVCDEKCRSFD